MGFTIAHGTPQMTWAPVSPMAGTLYVGQLVKRSLDGVTGMLAVSGKNDLNHKITTVGQLGSSSGLNGPIGIVVGTNLKTPAFSSVWNAESITFANPNDATNETYVLGAQGPWSAGDTRAMVKVAIIDPTTVLRANINHSTSTLGTAPTVGTFTASAGISGTTATMGVTSVAELSTMYFRSGSNVGTYRIVSSASATTHTWDVPVTNSTGTSGLTGDTVVLTNLPSFGKGRMQTSTTPVGLWVDGSAACTADFLSIDVIRLDLSIAGSEYVEFKLDTSNFIAFGNCS